MKQTRTTTFPYPQNPENRHKFIRKFFQFVILKRWRARNSLYFQISSGLEFKLYILCRIEIYVHNKLIKKNKKVDSENRFRNICSFFYSLKTLM